jgi:hypothetical protein
MRRKNLNALKWIECKEVNITRNDVGRTATHSKFEELVVLRITASCDLYIHVYPMGLARESRQKNSYIFFINVAAESLSAKDFAEFCEYRQGKQDLMFSERQIEGLTRFRIGQEQSANEDVGVEDAAQLGALQERIQYLGRESAGLRPVSYVIENLLKRRVLAGSQLAQP